MSYQRTAPSMKPIRRALGTLLLSIVSSAAFAQEEEQTGEPDGKAQITMVYEKAKEAKTIDDFTEIVDLCEEIKKTDITKKQSDYLDILSSWVLNRRGNLLVRDAAKLVDEGKTDEAEKLDKKALADFEASISKDPTRWLAVHNRGVSYAQFGRMDEALKDFVRVNELNPNYAKAWFNRGEAHYSLGDFEQAVQAYNRSLRLSPVDHDAYISRGHSYFQLKRFREALDSYGRAVQLNPDDGETLANRADAYQSLRMWQRAANDYRRAIALDENLARAYQNAAWLMATCPDERFRNPDRALASASRAMQISEQKDYRIYDTLAAAQASSGNFDEAKVNMEKAVSLAPGDEREELKKRLELYEKGEPYRQGMFGQSSNPATSGQAR